MSTPSDLTQLLVKLSEGDQSVLPKITPVILAELQRLARREMSKENSAHTLQATALVNETYMKLVNMDLEWQNRGHFYLVAARQMRRILVDHARHKSALKRAGNQQRLDIDDTVVVTDGNITELLYVDQLLKQLEEFDNRAARLFEMRLFSGLSNSEIADLENLSLATVERDLRAAKAWMKTEMGRLE